MPAPEHFLGAFTSSGFVIQQGADFRHRGDWGIAQAIGNRKDVGAGRFNFILIPGKQIVQIYAQLHRQRAAVNFRISIQPLIIGSDLLIFCNAIRAQPFNPKRQGFYAFT